MGNRQALAEQVEEETGDDKPSTLQKTGSDLTGKQFKRSGNIHDYNIRVYADMEKGPYKIAIAKAFPLANPCPKRTVCSKFSRNKSEK